MYLFNSQMKRQIASRVLLAVLLPMLLLSSFHIHSIHSSCKPNECSDCVEHHCGGHITQQELTFHECLLCQFLSLPMLTASILDVIPTNSFCKISLAQSQSNLLVRFLSINVTRGPPAV